MKMLRNDLYKPWFVGEKDWGFEIISGDYLGTVVQIKKLDFPQDDENLAIDFHTISKPSSVTDEMLAGDNFKLVFETIVNDILTEALDTLKDEQDRDNNIKESNPQ